SFKILDEYKDDAFYLNINILFNFLRYVYYDNNQVRDKSKIYFDILDFKIEELMTRYHFNANTSLFLFRKLRFHKRTNTVDQLLRDVDNYISTIEIEPYRLTFFVNFHMFLAHSYFAGGKYKKAARILFNLLNEVNLRKQVHMELEVKFFLSLCYVVQEDFDLANQQILALQRKLRKPTMARYEHGKVLLKILSVALGGKPRTKMKNLHTNIDKWKDVNQGRYALLEEINLEKVFLKEETASMLL
ncbi:MAG: hypothetical protein AAF399_29245, partial [Bacteroidota bacterium]